MEMFISRAELLDQLYHHLCNFFNISEAEKIEIEETLESVLQRCFENFQSSDNKYFNRGFNPCHSVMYMIFLYYLSNELYKRNKCTGLCDKVYYSSFAS